MNTIDHAQDNSPAAVTLRLIQPLMNGVSRMKAFFSSNAASHIFANPNMKDAVLVELRRTLMPAADRASADITDLCDLFDRSVENPEAMPGLLSDFRSRQFDRVWQAVMGLDADQRALLAGLLKPKEVVKKGRKAAAK